MPLVTTETDPGIFSICLDCIMSEGLSTEKLMKWLNPPNPSTNHNNARDKHHENTGQWLLGDERYVTWKQQANSFMWINGICKCHIQLIVIMVTGLWMMGSWLWKNSHLVCISGSGYLF